MSVVRQLPARRLSAVVAVSAAIALGSWALPVTAQVAPPSPPAPQAEATPTVSIVARGAILEAPDSVPAGLVRIAFQNATADVAGASIYRLKPGATAEAVSAALIAEDEATLFSLTTPSGGVGAIASGGSQEVTLTLTEGDYVLVGFSDEAPLVRPFRVVGLAAGGEVIMRDFSFSVPTITAGRTTLKVVNVGPQPHEMLLGKLTPGVALREVLDFDGDPVEAGFVDLAGGLAAVDAGVTAWVTPTFTPGSYAMICFITDPVSGRPHFELGMVTEFTVP